MWTDIELKLFKEFIDLDVSKLTIEHLKVIKESAQSFDGKLSSNETMKLIELTEYLLSK